MKLKADDVCSVFEQIKPEENTDCFGIFRKAADGCDTDTLHYTVDGIHGEFTHTDGKRYGVDIKEMYADQKNIKIDRVTDIEIDGIDLKDAPDYCDAYFSHAVWRDSGKELTEGELVDLTDFNGEELNRMACEQANGG